MLETLVWISAVLWALLVLQMLMNLLLIPDLSHLRSSQLAARPFVSIVVPARNEERGIRRAVESFCGQDYEDLEVIVVDDKSTDGTPEILAELQSQNANLTVISGDDPPNGWLGKPNALETGRKAAKGDWLLFVDADVVYAPDLVSRAMAFALERKVGMLILWPRFATSGVLEAVLMSSLHLVTFACFPLFLVARTNSSWFAAGVGVFNLVRRDALQACGVFESLKDAVLDDVGLGYRVKGAGQPLAVALAGPLLYIRMYHGARDLAEGMTKNAFPMGRNHPWLMAAPFIVGTLLSLLPYAGLLIGLLAGFVSVPAITALALMHLVTGGLTIRFHQPWYVTFLNPVREVCWWGILLRSFFVFRREGLVWRGRRYDDSRKGGLV